MRLLASLTVSATALPVVLASVTPGLDRLESMPPRVRVALAGQLERFRALPDDEQRAIRELDEAMARLDPEERRRHLDLMHRYGSWYRGLDEDARRELDAAPIEHRLEIIRRRLGPAGAPDSPSLDFALWTRADTFNPVPLYDAAALLRVWASLDEADRRPIEAARSLDEATAGLRRIGRERGIEPSTASRDAFRVLLDHQGRLGQRPLRLVPEVADPPSWLLDPFEPAAGRPAGVAFPRRPGAPGPPPEGGRGAAARLAAARLALLRLAELDFVRGLRNRPEGAASPAELAAFEARLPEWYRATLDPLPPEVLRVRLRALRRLAVADPALEGWLSSPGPTAPAGPAPPEGRPAPVTPS